MSASDLATLFALFAVFVVPILIGMVSDYFKLNRIQTGRYDVSQLYHD